MPFLKNVVHFKQIIDLQSKAVLWFAAGISKLFGD